MQSQLNTLVATEHMREMKMQKALAQEVEKLYAKISSASTTSSSMASGADASCAVAATAAASTKTTTSPSASPPTPPLEQRLPAGAAEHTAQLSGYSC
jgi:septal ring factor EnvC (AmiA/AmiB activator)